MRKWQAYLLRLGVAALCILGLTGKAAAKEQEKKVTLDQVPAAVKATILKEANGAKIKEIEQATQGDKVVYEAEWVIDGKKTEIKVAADGTVLGQEGCKDDEDDEGKEEKTSLDKVPEAVKATIMAEAKGVKIEEVEKVTKDGQTLYKAEWVTNGKETEVSVAPDGKLLKTEVEDADKEEDDEK